MQALYDVELDEVWLEIDILEDENVARWAAREGALRQFEGRQYLWGDWLAEEQEEAQDLVETLRTRFKEHQG